MDASKKGVSWPTQKISAPLQRWFFDYLNSGQPDGAPLEVHYVNAITLIGAIDILASVFLEYSAGNTGMALFMGAILFCALLNVILLRRTLNASLATTLILLTMLVMLTAMLTDGMYQKTAPIWFATFPAIAFFFKGKSKGLMWLGALLTIILLMIFAQGLDLLHPPFTNSALALLIASTATVGMMVYVYESMRAKAEASLHEAREKLHHLAHNDALTTLPNRIAFYDRLSQALEQATREERRLAVLFIDLDNFKPINDTYGHEAGDQLLVQAAARLRKQLRGSDFIARFGGDEFVAILPGIADQHEAGIVADKLIHTLARPFTIQDHECRVGISIGIGLYPECASSVNALVQLADHAMYCAKQDGKNAYALCPIHQGQGSSPYKGQCHCNKTCLASAGATSAS